MSIPVHVLADTPIRLWGIGSRERLRRQIAQIPSLSLAVDADTATAAAPTLLVRADYLFELRTLKALSQHPDTVLLCPSDGRPAAAMVAATSVSSACTLLTSRDPQTTNGLATITPDTLRSFDARLRRAEAPLLEPIVESGRARLEALLYGNSYKGITDLVTKWLWPTPARWGVRLCAHLGISPNAVTGLGVLLMLAAGVLFWQGHHASGLALGWFMTYLDTVDGKLARVTVQSSRFGHLLDHGMDLLHPPFWYLLWGMSLSTFQPLLGLDQGALYLLIFAGYAGGRLIEGAFDRFLGCAVFSWRPFDAYFRLITARRNPCLILLTGALALGRPDWGLTAVAVWTALTTAVLAIRLIQAIAAHRRHGPLTSWLADDAEADRHYPRAYRTFANTRAAYAQ